MLQNEDSEGQRTAGSKGTEQGEGEGVEDQDHAGKMAERIRKFKRSNADGDFGRQGLQQANPMIIDTSWSTLVNGSWSWSSPTLS